MQTFAPMSIIAWLKSPARFLGTIRLAKLHNDFCPAEDFTSTADREFSRRAVRYSIQQSVPAG